MLTLFHDVVTRFFSNQYQYPKLTQFCWLSIKISFLLALPITNLSFSLISPYCMQSLLLKLTSVVLQSLINSIFTTRYTQVKRLMKSASSYVIFFHQISVHLCLKDFSWHILIFFCLVLVCIDI